MEDLSKIKLLEDLKEEEFKLRQELNDKKKDISVGVRNRLVDEAFDEFKTFFEEKGFTAQPSGHLGSSYRSLLVRYKNASYSLWFINEELQVKAGADGAKIFSVGIQERIGSRGGAVSAFGTSKIDTDIELARKEIERLNHSLLNIDQFVCLYKDSFSGVEYESFKSLLESHFK